MSDNAKIEFTEMRLRRMTHERDNFRFRLFEEKITVKNLKMQMETLREELERLRRLVPTGTYTLNVAHEEEIQRLKDAGEVLIRSLERMTKERDEARAKADQYERDWYEAKSEFGSAMAKMREALRAAEKRELEALAELDEARAEAIRLHERFNLSKPASTLMTDEI